MLKYLFEDLDRVSLSDQAAASEQQNLEIMYHCVYSKARLVQDLRPFLENVTVEKLRMLLEDFYGFQTMDDGEDDYDRNNSASPLVEINRICGVIQMVDGLKLARRRRLL